MAKDDVKFTRKELKEDELVTFSAKAIKWLEANRKPVLTGIVSIIVIVVLYYSITGFIRYRAEKASNEYIEATELLAPKQKEMTTNLDIPSREEIGKALTKFEEIYNRYGFTGVGKISLLKMAQLTYELRDYEKSLKYTKEFLSKIGSDDPLHKSGLLLLANINFAKADYPEAINACEQILKSSSDFLKDEALYISARALMKQNKNDDAKNRLRELTEKYQSSHLRNEASEILKSL
ncbi:MAG: tetratricopeptide repeat protein [Deltaproteobacteria bacterium]|nr:tetratricopeptide repeat protein [Deltaproteobacteria bacterium]